MLTAESGGPDDSSEFFLLRFAPAEDFYPIVRKGRI